ncbi:MAG TPA: DUF937 domain-containing protein [Thermoanaerobaculia bacterium]|jgi:hypothetical protein|nr:DUF937 domain-containing protein [Thermoanaerobaculia bacterium]
MSIMDVLSSQLGPGTVQAVSRQLGIDEATAQQAIAAAVPMLTGGLARNAARPGGAEAIHQAVIRDHDGSLLDDVAGFLGQGQTGMGAAILGHVFGGNQNRAAAGLSQATGLDMSKASQLLMMLAPLVLAALGRHTRQNGLDAGGISDILSSSHAQAQAQAPAGLGGILGSLLDQDHDGSVIDDVGGLLGGLLKGR